MGVKKRGVSFCFSLKGKKAQEGFINDALINAAWLIIAVVISLGMLFWVRQKIDNSLLEKNLYVRDNGLIITSLYAAPGYVNYAYPKDMSKFILQFKDDKDGGKIRLAIKDEPIEVDYYYPVDKKFQKLDIVISSQSIQYNKAENNIIVRRKSSFRGLSPLECPEISIDKAEKDAVLLLEPFGEINDKGDNYFAQDKVITESEQMMKLARKIEAKIGKKVKRITYTRTENENNDATKTEEIIVRELPDIIISLNTYSKSDLSNDITARYKSFESEKSNALGCRIINDIIGDEALKDIIITGSSNIADENLNRYSSPIVVKLELGNFNHPDGQKLTSDEMADKLADSISAGIEDYFSGKSSRLALLSSLPAQSETISIGAVAKKEQLAGKEQWLDFEDIKDISDSHGFNMKLRRDTAREFNRMTKNAKSRGFNLELDYGYRGYEEEMNCVKKFGTGQGENKVRNALKKCFIPGISQTHWGTDVGIKTPNGKTEADNVLKWIKENSEKFGFYIEYENNNPEGYPDKPWHLTYKPLSDKIKNTYLLPGMITKDEECKAENDMRKMLGIKELNDVQCKRKGRRIVL